MVVDRKKATRASRISVDLKELRGPWLAWCADRQVLPSDALRRALGDAIGNGGPPLEPPEAVEDPDGPLHRLEVRLKPAEHVALTAAALDEGMPAHRYLVGLIRAQVMAEPQFSGGEVEVLARSNGILLGLSRNINRLSHDIQGETEADKVSLAQIAYLRDLIQKHVAAMTELMTANSRRWRR